MSFLPTIPTLYLSKSGFGYALPRISRFPKPFPLSFCLPLFSVFNVVQTPFLHNPQVGRSMSAHKIFSSPLARRTLMLFYFPIGKSTPTKIFVGSPFLYKSGDRTSRLRKSKGRVFGSRIPEPRYKSTLTLFLYSVRTSPIMILVLAMSSNSVLQLLSPDTPNFRCARELTFQWSLYSIDISEFAISQILMQCIRHFTPRIPDMVCHLSTHRLHCGPHDPLVFRISRFTIS
jgi:hypothetical protein